jgi:NhaA family Na+:H+ antiporter
MTWRHRDYRAVLYQRSVILSLSVAAGAIAVLALLNICNVRRIGIYILVGMVLWTAVLKSGVHATLAG